MARRLNLHEEFKEILGNKNVYYQPPASVKMEYPCITYSRHPGADKHNANDKLYMSTDRYDVTVIDRNPSTNIPDKILQHFPMCTSDREYSADNLNHYVFTIYY